MNHKTFALYDKNGKEVVRGEQFGLAVQGYCSVYSHLEVYAKKNYLLRRKYRVKIVEEQKKDNEFEYLQYHLNKFGNTFTRKNPAIYCDELHKMGIDINITRMKDSRGIGYLVDKI